MTQPTNQGGQDGQDWQDWEDIIPDETGAPSPEKGTVNDAVEVNPFAPGRPVDGYELTDNPKYPELRFQPQPQVEPPARPRRDPPKRLQDRMPATGVWQPGGPARAPQPQVRVPRPNVAAALLFGLIPLGLLAGGIYLVTRLYG